MADPTENTVSTAKASKALKKYKVTIHSEGEGGDKGDVLLGHNFKLMQIKRNVPVEIDENFLNALKSSVINTHVKDEDSGKMRPVQIPRYSFDIEAV